MSVGAELLAFPNPRAELLQYPIVLMKVPVTHSVDYYVSYLIVGKRFRKHRGNLVWRNVVQKVHCDQYIYALISDVSKAAHLELNPAVELAGNADCLIIQIEAGCRDIPNTSQDFAEAASDLKDRSQPFSHAQIIDESGRLQRVRPPLYGPDVPLVETVSTLKKTEVVILDSPLEVTSEPAEFGQITAAVEPVEQFPCHAFDVATKDTWQL